jgi:DNA repair exonuclease SbcCD ATPase subunit
MRLVGVELENFRSYGEGRVFDCSADVVILVGPNGYGKTSFFDSIGWCLFGDIRRLRGSRDAVGTEYVLNHFAEEGAKPRVTVHMSEKDRLVSVERVARRLQVMEGGQNLTGSSRERLILELFPLGQGSVPLSIGAAQSHFYRSFLLGQDQMADFVRDTSPRDRFDALVSLLGVEIVRDFYQHEEGHLGSLQASIDELRAQELEIKQELQALREERQRLKSDPSITPRGISAVVSELRKLAGQAKRFEVSFDTEEFALGEARDALNVARQFSVEVQIAVDQAAETLAVIRDVVEKWPSVTTARRRMKERLQDRERLERSLGEVRSRFNESRLAVRSLERRKRELEKQKRPLLAEVDDLRRFLIQALEHVQGDRCPLCEQSIKAATLRRRIEARVTEVPQTLREIDAQLRAVVGEQRAARTRIERQRTREEELSDNLAGVNTEIEALDLRVEEFDANLDLVWSQDRRPLLREVRELLAAAESEVRPLRRLAAGTKDLVSRAEMVASLDQVAGIRHRETALRQSRRDFEARRQSAAAAERSLRKVVRYAKLAEREIVRDLLQRRHPLLTALYRRLRPHPIFDELRIDYKKFAERGEAYFTAASREGEMNVATTFSSAQLNAVAVCVFLSLNLTQIDRGLVTALLDDPIQNMDDFNVLGLLDLVRQLAKNRQVVISTHDSQIGELMRTKLRPTEPGRRTITHRFIRYDSSGPEFKTETDEYEEEPLVLESALAGRTS